MNPPPIHEASRLDQPTTDMCNTLHTQKQWKIGCFFSLPENYFEHSENGNSTASAKIGDHFYKPDDQGIYGAYILCSVYLKKDCFKFTHAFLAKFFKVNLSAFSNLKERANKPG